jgi:uncharacterized membrane protein
MTMLDRVTATVGPRLPRSASPVWRPVLYANLVAASVLVGAVISHVFVRNLQPGLGIAQMIVLPVIFAVASAREIAWRYARTTADQQSDRPAD